MDRIFDLLLLNHRAVDLVYITDFSGSSFKWLLPCLDGTRSDVTLFSFLFGAKQQL